MSKTYIHYGHTKFDREAFRPIHNRRSFTKPEGGLWASPVDAEFGWKQWCDREEFRECQMNNSFTFTLSENARVITILSVNGAKVLPQQDNPIGFDWVMPDFEKLLEQGWDAVELVLSNDWGLYWSLYGWDCDSIVILNPDVIVEVTE